jgi:hypothetical protein
MGRREVLPSNLGLGHCLLLGQSRDHLVAGAFDGIIAGADRLGSGQLQGLQDAHVWCLQVRYFPLGYSQRPKERPQRQSMVAHPADRT